MQGVPNQHIYDPCIQSMYRNIKSRVKFDNVLSDEFSSYIGVRQGECLSPFLFGMYLNDLENEFVTKGLDGFDIGMFFLSFFLSFFLLIPCLCIIIRI